MDLYKHYLEMTLKFNVFYYAVTGAVLSFYFSNAANANCIYVLGDKENVSDRKQTRS